MVEDAEIQRLSQLWGLSVLDTDPEGRFDQITEIVTGVLDIPISLISLVDAERQWFKANTGASVPETDLNHSICKHAILENECLIIEDAKADPGFKDHPAVTGPMNLGAYAGFVLRAQNGQPLGTLCAIDTKPRKFSGNELDLLRALTRMVERELLPTHRATRQRSWSALKALVDPLTGLFLVDALVANVLQAGSGATPDTLCIASIDPPVSEEVGQDMLVSDTMALKIADRLVGLLGPGDVMAARLAPLTFCVLLDKGADPDILDKLQAELSRDIIVGFEIYNPDLKTTCVSYDAASDDLHAVIENAFRAHGAGSRYG